MNEILAPIYYIFAQDPHPDYANYAEEDAFYCFTALMAEIRDGFVKTLDRSTEGIAGYMQRVSDLLKSQDPAIWQHLEELSIQPLFYAIKWVLLLFTQDYEIPDVLRIWDSLLSDPYRFKYLYYMCIAKILHFREELINSDFAQALTLLQKHEQIEADVLIAEANQLIIADARVNRMNNT